MEHILGKNGESLKKKSEKDVFASEIFLQILCSSALWLIPSGRLPVWPITGYLF